MKIICKDELNRANVADILFIKKINRFSGRIIVKLLNYNPIRNPEQYYTLEDDSYLLWDSIENIS